MKTSTGNLNTSDLPARLILILFILPVLAGGAAAQGWDPQPAPVASDLRGVYFQDAETGWICGALGTVLHTTNGGSDWVVQESNAEYTLRSISFADPDLGLAVGEGGTIIRTSNGGASWTVIRTGWMDTLRDVHFVTPSFAYAVGTNAIFQPFTARSTDGGLNWSFGSFYIQNNEGGLTGVHFTDELNGFASAYVWDGRGAVCRTTNGGLSWSTSVVVAMAMYAIDFPSSQVGVAAGLNGNVLRSADGGATWGFQSAGMGHDLNAVSFPEESTGWVVGGSGWISRTTNGGGTWTQQQSGTTATLQGIHCVDTQTGTVAGSGGLILRTTTGGDDPAAAPEDPPSEDPDGGGPETAPAGRDAVGDAVRLVAAVPNPFHHGTSIRYQLLQPSSPEIVVCDVSGRMVRRLPAVPGAAGDGSIRWDGRDGDGRSVGPGIYFLTATGSPQGSGLRVVKAARQEK